MATQSKQLLAQQVVDLTVMNRARATATRNGQPDPEMAEKIRARMREEQTALHVKHFAADQLQALLDFYSTEMGKSILKSQEKIADDIASGFRLVSGAFTDSP